MIEEADKPEIGPEHFDSAGSSVTDTSDRFVAVANPPRDETNVVAQKTDSPRWEVVQFDSFDSHNVLAAREETDADPIPGLVTLDLIREDYEAWNRREWPGVDAARDPTGGLDERWYRRRLGMTPPESASANRPFYLSDVKGGFARPDEVPSLTGPPAGLALDVARKGGDENVLGGVFPTDDGGRTLRVIDAWSGLDHNANESRVRRHLGEGGGARFAIDATGEGSGLADRIDNFYPEVVRFDAGRNAVDEERFKNYWTEALAHFGEFFDDGGVFTDRDVREQALAAARAVEYEERYYQSRDATVYQASSKDAVKEVLGHSPDHLDVAIMACWAATDETVDDGDGVTYSTRSAMTTKTGSRSGSPADKSPNEKPNRAGSGPSVTRRTR